jgi:hypothetical protein
MKFEQTTLDILRNFQSINNSIVLHKGSRIVTMSDSKTCFAAANIDSEIPRNVPIYDLSKFLGILSLSNESEIDFHDNHMIINQGSGKVKYVYAEESLINSPNPEKKIKLPHVDVTFDLTTEVLNTIRKAMGILKFNELVFSGYGGKLYVETLSVKNESSDSYSIEIGETDIEFKAVIKAETLHLLPRDYTVSICGTKSPQAAHFVSDQVEYFVALSTDSVF